MIDKARQADVAYLQQARVTATTSERKIIDNSLHTIRNESERQRSFRNEMIREADRGRMDNVKDMQEYAAKRYG